MILYLSGIASYPELLDRLDTPNVLTSYVEKWKPDRDKCGRLFLDSGAYTAFNTGKQIDINQYIDYCLGRQHEYDVVAALDVIGDAEASIRNYKLMSRAGVNILPVFHLGNDYKHFYALMDGYDYIGVGAIAHRIASSSMRHNSEAMMRNLTFIHREAQKAKIKLHGFGATSALHMSSFPWESIDSTTFLVGARFGHLLLPTPSKGFSQPSNGFKQKIRSKINGDDRIQKLRNEFRRHVYEMGSRYGFSVDDLYPDNYRDRQFVLNRLEWNCRVMMDYVSNV